MSAIDSILTTEQYQAQQANAIYKDGQDGDMLGRDAFLQLFTAGCVGAGLTNFPAAVARGCAGAALTNCLAGVFRRLPRRSSHHL